MTYYFLLGVCVAVGLCTCFLCFLLVQYAIHKIWIGENVRWAIAIYESDSPLGLSTSLPLKPTITKYHVKDKVRLVADPFLFEYNKKYYIFYEALNDENGLGEIAVSSSNDSKNWEYEGIALKKKYHLSYPFLFSYDKAVYMVVESGWKSDKVILYKSVDFPLKWKVESVLFQKKHYVDTTIFFYNHIWWLFTSDLDSSQAYLYYADRPQGPWTSHPQNPVVAGDRKAARSGGRVRIIENKLVRLVQNANPYYGKELNAYQITKLDKQNFAQTFLYNVTSPVTGSWMAKKTHHLDSLLLPNGKWLVAIDGGGGKDHYHFVYTLLRKV